MKRRAASAAVALILLGGICWWTFRAGSRGPQSTDRPASIAAWPGNSSRGDGPRKKSAVEDVPAGNGHSSVKQTSGDAPPFDADRTSWHNPFVASYWKSDGWLFDPAAMQSRGGEPAIATFRRDYRKVTVVLSVEPVGEMGIFQVRLFSPTAGALLEAELSSRAVVVSSEISGKRAVIERHRFRVPLAAGEPTRLRLTATGNRVMIVSGRKVLINCSQPAEQSGRPLQISLRGAEGAFRISSLHFEGQ